MYKIIIFVSINDKPSIIKIDEEEMNSKYYKNIFKFFYLTCVLSIKFDGKRFLAPKSLRFKSIFLMSFVLIVRNILRFHEHNNHIHIEESDKKIISIFFVIFVGLMMRIIEILPFICTLILLVQQEKIAKIFTTFYELKIICCNKNIKINDKNLFYKILKSFIVFGIISFFVFDFVDLYLRNNIKLITIIISILDQIMNIYYLLTLDFYYIILIHFELLVNNFNQIIKDRIDFIHENCEELLQKLTIIQELFDLLNQALGKIFSFEALDDLLYVISFVRNFFLTYKN